MSIVADADEMLEASNAALSSNPRKRIDRPRFSAA
jgi:hypothetical protein